jgi:acyl carrier protein
MSTVEGQLRDVFVRALELPGNVNVAAIRYRGHPNWDSLGHMSLVVAIEEEFGVEFEPDDLIEMKSFQDALGILQRVGVNG